MKLFTSKDAFFPLSEALVYSLRVIKKNLKINKLHQLSRSSYFIELRSILRTQVGGLGDAMRASDNFQYRFRRLRLLWPLEHRPPVRRTLIATIEVFCKLRLHISVADAIFGRHVPLPRRRQSRRLGAPRLCFQRRERCGDWFQTGYRVASADRVRRLNERFPEWEFSSCASHVRSSVLAYSSFKKRLTARIDRLVGEA